MSDSWCKYRNVLGIPGKGFHTHFLGVAWGDVIGTLLISLLIVSITKWDYSLVTGILFIIAAALHKAFCIRS